MFKARYIRQVQVLSQKTATVKAAAKEANRTIIDATELPSAAREIFDKLNLSNELIAELVTTFKHARADGEGTGEEGVVPLFSAGFKKKLP